MNRRRLTAARRLLRESWHTLLDTLAPVTCGSCGELGGGRLCDACRAALELRVAPACGRCGEPVIAAGEACTADHAWLRGLLFVCAPFRYRGAGGAIVRRLKFESDAVALDIVVRAVACALHGYAHAEGRRALVVHVPMHRRRRRQRGFDQAERLALALARALGLEFQTGVLVRHRATASQTDPRVTSRTKNVEGAFRVAREAQVLGRRILLVDDVTTSGSTARECAAVLRAAGARSVALAVAAVG